MSDELRPNPLLDELWEAAGKSVERFAERTNKAANDTRPNTLLEEAFTDVKGLTEKSRTPAVKLSTVVKDIILRFTQLRKEIVAATLASSKSRFVAAHLQLTDLRRVAGNAMKAPNQLKPDDAQALREVVNDSRTVLKATADSFRKRRQGSQQSAASSQPNGNTSAPNQPQSNTAPPLNPLQPRNNPSRPSGPSSTWSTIITGIQEKLKNFREWLRAGTAEIAAEFKHTADQLMDFGKGVVAGTSSAISAVVGIGAKIASTVSPFVIRPMVAFGTAIRSSIGTIAKSIVDLGVTIRDRVSALSNSVSNSSIGKTLRDVGQAIYQPLAALGALVSSAAGIMAKGFGDMIAWINDFNATNTGKKKDPRKGEENDEEEDGFFSQVGGVISSIMAGFNAMMSGLNFIGNFVQTVNPGIMMQFQMVMRDLSAVIGTALAPIMQAVVPLFRSLADTLYPLAKQFAEILKPFLEVVSELVESVIKLIGSIVGALMPVIRTMSDGLAVMAGALSALVDTVRVLFDGCAAFIGSFFTAFKPGEFKETIDFIISGFRSLSQYIILAAASVAKFFGATSFITGMIESYKTKGKKEDTTGLSAAQNPAYKSIEELGRSMALQAAIATSGVPEKKTQDQIGEETVQKLDDIAKNGVNLEKILVALPLKIAEAIKSNTSEVVQNAATNTYNWVADAADAFATLPQNLATLAPSWFNH